MRPMRRAYQQVDERATLERWLGEALVGRLATIDENGYPVIKPVNFVYAAGKIIFHSAKEGEKLDDIRRDERVCFEVDELIAVTPPIERGCQTHCFYRSVIIRGRARVLDAFEDRRAKEESLRLLIQKYSPGFADTPLIDIDQTAVVEITVEQVTGKEDIGQRWSAERKQLVANLLVERDDPAAEKAIVAMGLGIEAAGEKA